MQRKTMCWSTGAARMLTPVVLLLLLCLAPAYSYGASIFTEGFETGAPGTTGWATGGTTTWYTGTPKNGAYSVRLGRNGTLQRTISTRGYDTIAVSFYLGTSFASNNQSVRVRYTTNGSSWTTLVTLTTTTAWKSYGPYSLPAGAADNTQFALRCEATTSSGSNYGYFDDVIVTGNPKSYLLSFTGTGGTINVNSVNHPLTWSGTFIYGTVVSLEAVPSLHYHFANWSGDLSGSTNPTTITVSGTEVVGVNFSVDQYTLSIASTSGGLGVYVNGSWHWPPWSGPFDYGSTVTVQALAFPGYSFLSWTGDITSTDNPETITITGDTSITANYVGTSLPRLTVSGSHGSVQVDGGAANPLPWSSMFPWLSQVQLVAVPDYGYHFVQWTGDATGTSPSTTIRMFGDRNVTAVFALNQYQLSLSGSGGQVSVNGTSHPLPWSGMFDHGTTVTLAALPTAPNVFTGWSGGLTGTTNPTSILMDGAKSVTANFTTPQYALNLSGTNGSVTVNGTPHALPWSGSFAAGTPVTLQAVANAHYHFTGWSGDLTGTTNPTTTTMDGTKNITAGFAIDQFQLSFTIGAHGGVTVNGVLQTGSYTHMYDYGTVVTLNAVADAHYHLTGWSGDLTGTTNPTSVTMDSTKSITVGFAIDQFQLSLSGSHGNVKVNGVSHPLSWSGMIDYGTAVTLEAVPDAHYHFTGWSGDVTGTTNPASIASMDSAKTIAVGFAIDQFALSLSGTNGSVKVDDVPHTLPWSATYDYGTVVKVEAVPDLHRSFTGWSGDLTGTTNPASITMDGAKTITVGFGVEQMQLTVSGSSGAVLVNTTTVETLPWTGSFDYGAKVTLEPLPDSCDRFDGWTSGGSDPDFTNPLALTMDRNRTITANFSSLEVFSDVSCDFWAVREIVACVKENVVVGYPDGTYKPEVTVSRDQMAVYISRALAGGDANVPTGPAQATFPDVDPEYWAYKYIEYAVANNIVVGYPNGRYEPTVPVDRGQMAVFISRAIVTPTGDEGLKSYVPPAHPDFPDVNASFWAYNYIEYLYSQEIVHGYLDGTYRPDVPVTRDQMAVYVQRAFQYPE